MDSTTVLDTVAYIDAGTGSYLLAAIASGAAGLWMFFRSCLARFRRKLRRGGDEEPVAQEDHDVESGADELTASEDDAAEESSARG